MSTPTGAWSRAHRAKLLLWLRLNSKFWPEAKDGFAGEKLEKNLQVAFPEELLIALPADKREALLSALSQDPRPAYQQDGEQYGFEFSGLDVRFSVDGDTLTVFDVTPAGSQKLK